MTTEPSQQTDRLEALKRWRDTTQDARVLDRYLTRGECDWLLSVITAADELAVAAQYINCLRVQRDIDRDGVLRAGTCLWDTRTERLLDKLPTDACWPCKARDALATYLRIREGAP